MGAKLARDWDAEFRQSADEQNEAWNAYIEALAIATNALAGKRDPTKEVLDKTEEAEQRFKDVLAKHDELMKDFRASQP